MKISPISPATVFVLATVLFVAAAAAQQTKILLATVNPGTEQVELVANGAFQQPGPPVGGDYPNPAGWDRWGRMYVTSGINMLSANQGVVAQAQVSQLDPIAGYFRTLTLEAATEYVLSAYLWNLGDANNHVTTVVDLNDAPNEAQLTLNAGDPMADHGYFVYASFNTSNTGTNLTVRCFYDGLTGTGAAPQYYPVGAQWDNIAITRADLFEASVRHSQVFYNAALIAIPDVGPAAPYPSTITVSNIAEPITKVTVTLSGLAHTFPADVDILLVGPGGQSVLLMSDAGTDVDVNEVTLSFDDSAPDPLPETAALSSGRFRPTDYGPGDVLVPPAPPVPYGTNLSVFKGTQANGVWQLFVGDDTFGDFGFISNGWELLITTEKLVITAQPEGVLADLGATIRLSVGAGGVEPLRYQWRLNGAAIPGATDSSLSLFNLPVADCGVYCVSVANDFGAISSEPVAVLPINVPSLPPSDSFFGATPLGPASGVIRGANLFASKEPGEPDHAGKRGGRSVWYQWYANNGGVAMFNTRGSGFDTLLAVYTGDGFPNLTRVASDEDGGGFFTSTLRFNATEGQNYHVAIDGLAGAEGTFLLQWVLDSGSAPLPLIDTGPVSQTVTQGATAAFSVSSTPSGLSYQWYFSDAALAGATGPTLTLTNVQADNVGTYRVRVSNGFGQFVDGAPALLEIGPDTAFQSRDKLEDLLPDGGFLSPAGLALPLLIPAGSTSSVPPFISVRLGSSSLGQVLNNQGALGDCQNHCGAITVSTRWLCLVPQDAGEIEIDTVGSSIPTVLAVYTKSNARLTEVACDKSDSISRPCHVCFNAKKGTNYYVVVDGSAGQTGAIKLNWKLSDIRLDIARAGTNAVLWWCSSADAYQLHSSPELKLPPGVSLWSPVTNAVAFDRGTNRVLVAIPAAPSKGFFRLKKR